MCELLESDDEPLDFRNRDLVWDFVKKSFKARFIDRCLTVKPTQLTKEEHSYFASWLEEDWTTRQLYHLLQHVRYVLKSQGIHQSKRRLDDLIKRFGFHE